MTKLPFTDAEIESYRQYHDPIDCGRFLATVDQMRQPPTRTAVQLPEPRVRVLGWVSGDDATPGFWLIVEYGPDKLRTAGSWYVTESEHWALPLDSIPFWQPLPPDPTAQP